MKYKTYIKKETLSKTFKKNILNKIKKIDLWDSASVSTPPSLVKDNHNNELIALRVILNVNQTTECF